MLTYRRPKGIGIRSLSQTQGLGRRWHHRYHKPLQTRLVRAPRRRPNE